VVVGSIPAWVAAEPPVSLELPQALVSTSPALTAMLPTVLMVVRMVELLGLATPR